MERYIDLHTHSAFSDGTCTPDEVIRQGSLAGLAAVALTDHDTVDGVDEAKAAAEKYGVEVIEGIEIVAEYNKSEIHILGYFIDYNGDYFTGKLNELKQIRKARNERLIERLRQIKMPVGAEELLDTSGGRQVTRMHFAKTLVKKGYVNSVAEAFDRYLSEDRPAYVGRNAFTFQECIEIIKTAGGVSVLAHPYGYKWQGGEVIQMIETLAESGINGIEVIYPTFDEGQRKKLKQTAERLNLKITGGSDFHGENKPNRIGTGIDENMRVPYELLEKLRG